MKTKMKIEINGNDLKMKTTIFITSNISQASFLDKNILLLASLYY